MKKATRSRQTRPSAYGHPLRQLRVALALALVGLLVVLGAATAQASGTGGPGQSKAAPRPNLVFLLADDLRWDATGFAGNPIVRTPHLDSLAKQGTRFSQCFVTTSICCVSRASIFTGQYAARHGIHDFDKPLSPVQWADSYPARLRAAGYRTGFIGKFGVGNAPAVAAMAAQFDFWRGLPGQAGLFFSTNDPTHTHATARMGSEGLEFIDSATADQPFCLSISFSAPHARDGERREFCPDDRDTSLYADAQIPAPDKVGAAWFEQLPAFLQKSEGRPRWQRRFSTDAMRQDTTRDYYRLISGIDREVGRIMDALRARHLDTNTVLVFASDNGFFLGERGLADKWLPYEESMRVPLMIWDGRPGRSQQGKLVDRTVLNVDIAPTLLGLAGAPQPVGIQGASLMPLLSSSRPAKSWRTEFYYEHRSVPTLIPPSEALRTSRWKYIRWIGQPDRAEELYDLRADPQEHRNLAEDRSNARTLRSLRAHCDAMALELK